MSYTKIQLLPNRTIRALHNGLPVIIKGNDSLYEILSNREDIIILPEIIEVLPTLEEIKASKLLEIKEAFETISSSGYTVSSLGYKIDATTTSLNDVQGLIRLIDSNLVPTPVMFRDYDNEFHEVTLDNLKTFEIEITSHGVTVYAQKWSLENQLDTATTIEEVNVIDPHSMSGYDW